MKRRQAKKRNTNIKANKPAVQTKQKVENLEFTYFLNNREQFVELVKYNMSIAKIIEAMNISNSTFYKWKNEHPEVQEAINEGHDRQSEDIGTLAFKALRDGLTDRVKILHKQKPLPNGEIVDYDEEVLIRSDPKLALNIMQTNRPKYYNKDKHEESKMKLVEMKANAEAKDRENFEMSQDDIAAVKKFNNILTDINRKGVNEVDEYDEQNVISDDEFEEYKNFEDKMKAKNEANKDE